jgi:hypothetical protein
MVKSKWVNGYLVYYDDYDFRWVDAVGPAARKWEMRIGTDFTTAAEYTNTQAGTSPTTQGTTAGIRALLTTGGTENNGCNLQVVGTPYQIASSKPFYFGAKVAISDATQSDFAVGLASLDTSIFAAHAVTVINCAMFTKLDAVTTILASTIKASAVSSDTVGTAMDTSAHVYEIYFDGTTLYYYFDAGLVSAVTAGWPTVVLSPSIALMAGEAAAKTATVEWMRCIQLP